MNSGGLAIRRALAACVLALATALPVVGMADEISPALLEISEREGGWVDVTWKIPVKQANNETRGLGLTPVLPDFLEPAGPPSGRRTSGNGYVEFSSYRTNGQSLTGSVIAVEGLGPIQTDVLVQIRLLDGTQHNAILRPGTVSYAIPAEATSADIAVSYWRMGTIHILEGADHLLFVLALMLIVVGFKELLKAVTAFTVAHSITLALATLGLVHMPAAPTEAIIALSIVFLATEIVHKRNGQVGLTELYPWMIAFAFGLFHGLGFAGALSEIGVPQHEVPLALLMFNVGVETGQLMFIGAVLALIAVLKKLPVTPPESAWRVLPYSIGGVAAFWTIDRVLSFLPM